MAPMVLLCGTDDVRGEPGGTVEGVVILGLEECCCKSSILWNTKQQQQHQITSTQTYINSMPRVVDTKDIHEPHLVLVSSMDSKFRDTN